METLRETARTIKRSAFSYIPPLLLAAAITFSGRTFTLGSIDPSWARQLVVRWEDIVIVLFTVMGLLKFFLSSPTSIRKPALFPVFPLWILFELISSLISSIMGYVAPARVLFYTLKSTEYAFIFFYIFYFIREPRDIKILMNWWLVFIWIHLAYVFYQFFAPTHYGIWLIGENGNFNVGAQFLVMALYSFSYVLFYLLGQPAHPIKKILTGIIFLTPIIGIFTAGIKAGAVAGVACILIILGLYASKLRSRLAFKQLGAVVFLLLTILVILRFSVQTLPYDFIYYRTLNFSSYFVSLNFRANIWQDHLKNVLVNPLHVLIGRGGGDPYAEASHNQFIRNFTAGGIIGSVLFLFLVFVILKQALHVFKKSSDPLTLGLSAGLFAVTIGMLIMGISGESFMIVRPAEHFWYFAGIAFATIYLRTVKTHTT